LSNFKLLKQSVTWRYFCRICRTSHAKITCKPVDFLSLDVLH